MAGPQDLCLNYTKHPSASFSKTDQLETLKSNHIMLHSQLAMLIPAITCLNCLDLFIFLQAVALLLNFLHP